MIVTVSCIMYFSFSTLSDEYNAQKAPIIILKADDLVFDKKHTVHPNWLRLVDFVEKNKIRASIGIVGNSLEKGNKEYLHWIKNVAKQGNIEFWNHGYDHSKINFF